jgi:hypothetical protein
LSTIDLTYDGDAPILAGERKEVRKKEEERRKKKDPHLPPPTFLLPPSLTSFVNHASHKDSL